MPRLITKPSVIEAAGTRPKHIEEFAGPLDVRAGEAVLAQAGETVRYSTPGVEGAKYVAVCAPAFSPELVHRGPGNAVGATSTEAVLQSHLRAATVGVDAVLQDYTDESVLITHDA